MIASPPAAAISATPSPRLWLPPLAPQLMLGMGGTFAILCVIGAYILATTQPSLGISWTTTDKTPGLVATVVSRTVTHFPIASGDRFVAIHVPGEAPIPLDRGTIIVDPDIHSSYADYNLFFLQQELIANALQRPRITFMHDDGRFITVVTRARRPLAELPFAFWIYNIGGSLSFLISLGVWCYGRGSPSPRLFAVSGFGFFCALLCLSVYGTRELALDASLFRALTTANHFFMLLMTFSLLGLFWFFPQRIGSSRVVVALYSTMFLFWLNESFQWYQVPLHPFYVLTFLVPYLFALPLAVLQWRRSRRRPVERAAFRWFLLAILISMGAAIAVFVIPPIYNVYLVFSLETSTLIALIMYIGLALGILRYRLFDLDRWWFFAWSGFLSLALFVVLDAAMIRLFHLTSSTAFALSFLAIVWLYFPIRQWFWTRLVDPPARHLEQYLPSLVESIFSPDGTVSLSKAWHHLLQNIFDPLTIRQHKGDVKAITLDQNGLVLRSKVPVGEDVLEMIGNRRGTKLFSSQDVELVEAISVLAKRFVHLQITHEETAARERDRIATMLHNDVGAKVRTLEHLATSDEERSLARSALFSLEDSLDTLKNRSPTLLSALVGDLRYEIRIRMAPLGIQVHWDVRPDVLDGIWLTPLQHLNCRSIVREAITNIIKHSHATEITIGVLIDKKNSRMTVRVTDNGNANNIAQWFVTRGGGQGLVNMKKHAEEMQGQIDFIKNEVLDINDATGLTATLTIPLTMEMSAREY